MRFRSIHDKIGSLRRAFFVVVCGFGCNQVHVLYNRAAQLRTPSSHARPIELPVQGFMRHFGAVFCGTVLDVPSYCAGLVVHRTDIT